MELRARDLEGWTIVRAWTDDTGSTYLALAQQAWPSSRSRTVELESSLDFRTGYYVMITECAEEVE